MNMISDRVLVGRCKRELPYQTRSFELLVERYKDRVFAKILGMVRNREEAEDVAQDVFVNVFQNLRTFREESAFSTWLYAITVNVCLNHIEKSKRRPGWWLAEDTAIDSDQIEDVSQFDRVTRRIESEQAQEVIDRTYKRLNTDEREVMTMRYLEEQDYATIAEKLNIGLSAAKMRVKRARETFQKAYNVERGRQ